MAFLDDLSRKLSMVGQEAATQTKAFAEQTRINAKITDEERQINSFYVQLGKNYFDAYKDDPTAQFSDVMSNIKDAMHRIDIYRRDIRRAKGVVNCPTCGAEVQYNLPYCSYCGGKMPEQQQHPFTNAQPSYVGGGIDGLGEGNIKNGSYSSPNSDGTQLNYGSTAKENVESFDSVGIPQPTNFGNMSVPQPTNLKSDTISLEKKD